MPRHTADLIALLLASVISLVVLSTAFVILYIQVTDPEADTVAAADAIGRIIAVLIGVLAGYVLRGRVDGNGA